MTCCKSLFPRIRRLSRRMALSMRLLTVCLLMVCLLTACLLTGCTEEPWPDPNVAESSQTDHQTADAGDLADSSAPGESSVPTESGTVGAEKDTDRESTRDTEHESDTEEESVPEQPADPPETITRPPVTNQPTVFPTGEDPYEGLMITLVHGTGKKGAEAVVDHGFVQLYNGTDHAISLAGLALYYRTAGDTSYVSFAFPDDEVIPSCDSYLVRANAPADIAEENLIMKISVCDAEWDIYIDNKEVSLVLASADAPPPVDGDITRWEDAVSVFYASTLNPCDSVFAVDDLTRQKMAVRTAKTTYSAYHLVHLSRLTTADLQALCPSASNGRSNEVVASRLEEVIFSHAAGIYPQAFHLALYAPEGYTIYYTTDGSDPSADSNRARKTYTGMIRMADTSAMAWGPTTEAWYECPPSVEKQVGGHVIKACAVKGSVKTPVYTNTYFITDDLSAYGVPVISISLPVEDIMEDGFYANYNPTGMITDTRPRAKGIMEVFDENGNRVGNSCVELAVSGNGSSGTGMKSLRVYYKGKNNGTGGLSSDLHYDLFRGLARDANGEAITSFSRLLLRNSGNDVGHSYIRDAYMQRVSASLHVDTMAAATTLVFINGEFWGVYNIRERYSPEYVESHYGVQKENVTVIESDYSQVHTNQNAPYVVSSGEPGDADPFNEMVDYIRTHDMSVQEHFDYVASLMDMDSFLDMWVVRIFFVARDWPENNIKVWRNKNPDDPSGMDTKWHFTLLDLDMGLSFYDFTTERDDFFWAFNEGSVCGTMMCRLIQNAEFRDRYILRFYEIVKDHLTPEYLSAELEKMIAERDPLMSLQERRWHCDNGFTVSMWQNACARMRSFVANRESYVLNQLYSYFGVTEDQVANMSERRVSVNFNETRTDVTLNGQVITSGTVIKFDEGETLTLKVQATADEGYFVKNITFTDRTGKVQTVEGGSATFRVSISGALTIQTRRTDAADLSNGQLIAGASYLFYLSSDGDLYAWGDNRMGVLGLGYAGGTVTTPTFVRSGVAKVVTSAANAYENGDTTFSTAILTTDGKVLTVGANTAGQLGRNGTLNDVAWGEIDFDGKVKDISIGHDHLLILDTSGTLWGIGSNSYGALGSAGVGGNVTKFQKLATGVATMSAGRRSTVYLGTDGRLWGVGDNRWKKLSQEYGDQIHTPVVIASNIAYMDSGEHQVLAVDKSGTLYYSGWRTLQGFQQGGGNTPTFVSMMNGVKKADIYFGNLVLLTKTGDAYVYGLNTENGIGSEAVTGGTPKKIQSGVADVAAGYGFTAYLMKDGRILIQGNNSFGQAGNGTTSGLVNMAEVDF